MSPYNTRWFDALEPVCASGVKAAAQDISAALCELVNTLGRQPVVGIACRSRKEWLSAWLAAYANNISVFLANPDWKEATWAEVAQQITPDAVFGDWHAPENTKANPPLGVPAAHWFIPTGGTGGYLKFIAHTETTFSAAAFALSEACGGGAVNSLSLLPLHHVSGLMPWARAAYTGGQVRFAEWHSIRNGALPEHTPYPEQLSLVPSQLGQLMESNKASEWLAQFKYVLLGGATCSKELVAKARQRGIAATPCYGMTETAAFIAWQPPENAPYDASDAATLLPHTRVSITEDNEIHLEGSSLATHMWQAEKACTPLPSPLPTGDTGELAAEAGLKVFGRKDRLINTGGEKVNPERVETVILEHDAIKDVHVTGLSDERWGQTLAAVVVLHAEGAQDAASLKTYLATRLEPPAVPKEYVFVEALPRNSAGKIQHEDALRLLSFNS